MRILGIDPRLLCTGWGVIEKLPYDNVKYVNCGAIKAPNTDSLEIRLKFVYGKISELIELYKPDAIAMEEVFINTNPESSKKLIMARTAALLACCNNDLHINEFTPNTIKKNITGNGHASKPQIHTMVQKILRITINKDGIKVTHDSLDALAVAICYAFFSKNF